MSDETKTVLAVQAAVRKQASLNAGFYAHIPHDLPRRLIPLAREYDRNNHAILNVYAYLLAHVNGSPDNARYMAAFPSVEAIARDTGVGHNRIARLANVLEAVGLLRVTYDYSGTKRTKLYYPQYYSALTDEEIRSRLDVLYGRTE